MRSPDRTWVYLLHLCRHFLSFKACLEAVWFGLDIKNYVFGVTKVSWLALNIPNRSQMWLFLKNPTNFQLTYPNPLLQIQLSFFSLNKNLLLTLTFHFTVEVVSGSDFSRSGTLSLRVQQHHQENAVKVSLGTRTFSSFTDSIRNNEIRSFCCVPADITAFL